MGGDSRRFNSKEFKEKKLIKQEGKNTNEAAKKIMLERQETLSSIDRFLWTTALPRDRKVSKSVMRIF